jgi:hypothetical protein
MINKVDSKNNYMNFLKKYLGLAWITLALLIGYFGFTVLGYPKLVAGNQEDLVFGIIIVFVLLPIIVGGLLIFGKYAWQQEYDLTDDAQSDAIKSLK